MKHVIPPATTDVTVALRNARRNVSLAILAEFENAAFQLGQIVATGYLQPATAADFLNEIADCHDLSEVHGINVVQSIIANGLTWRGDASTNLGGAE